MRIHIYAGLGNQLFQYAFYHYVISRKETNFQVKIVPNFEERVDRSFKLRDLLTECRHQDLIINREINFYQKILMSLYELISRTIILRSKFYFHEISEFKYNPKTLNRIYKHSLVQGYFQHWKYVDQIFHLIRPEIENYFQTFELSYEKLPTEFIGIHVRRGDNIYTLQSMGSLSAEYYAEIIKKYKFPNLPIVLFTDDIKGATDVIRKIKPKFILGPNDSTEWEALYLMSKSKILIMANSTFSWWAGYIGKQSGRTEKVFIPDPWFRNWANPILDAFQFPGSIICESKFIDSKTFETDYKLP